jgi:hypothetical protein
MKELCLQEPGERPDVSIERLACISCFRVGIIPGFAGSCGSAAGLPPSDLPPPAEEWHAGVLHALTEALQNPDEYFPPGYCNPFSRSP